MESTLLVNANICIYVRAYVRFCLYVCLFLCTGLATMFGGVFIHVLYTYLHC